jgi:MoaA/NifB/PqqE/SkfB family radical SAM enzyme
MPVKGTMSQGTFSRIIPYIKYFRGVSFCGNAESLVSKNVSSFLYQVRKESKGIHISMFTNGELLTEKLSREFIEYGLDSLVFSIDGVSPEIVDKIRRKGSLEKIISNIKNLQNIKKEVKARKPIVSSTMVLYKENFKQIPEVLRLLRKIGVWRLNVNGLEPYSEEFLSEILWNDPRMFQDVLEVFVESRKLAIELGMELLIANLIPQSGICSEVDRPIILANGDVVPCSVLAYPRPGFYSVNEDNRIIQKMNNKSQVTFGNINERELHEIWFDPDYVKFREKVYLRDFPDICENCLVKHRFICVRSDWSLDSVIDELRKTSSVVSEES